MCCPNVACLFSDGTLWVFNSASSFSDWSACCQICLLNVVLTGYLWNVTPIMENQMEHQMEHEADTLSLLAYIEGYRCDGKEKEDYDRGILSQV